MEMVSEAGAALCAQALKGRLYPQFSDEETGSEEGGLEDA